MAGNAGDEEEEEEEEEAMSEEDEEEAYEEEDGEDNEETEACAHGERDDDSDDDRSGQRSEDEDEGGRDQLNRTGSAVDELLELVFQLSITFSTEEFIDSQPSSSLLVYFSGILSLLSNARSFLPMRKYTLYLSTLIYF